MAVHAHPDDESSKGAATMAKYVAEGADVVVVTCTGGERGSILNPAMDRPEVVANLAEIRRREMERAREILGVRQEWLGFVDSGLPDGWEPGDPLPEGCFGLMDAAEAAAPLVALIRRLRPHVLLTYDETGGYGHPDHIKTHDISVVAFEAAGDPTRYPEAGEPWQPSKLYYHETFHKARVQALHDTMVANGIESHWGERLAQWVDRPEDAQRITTRVSCAEYFDVRDRALLAHETQVDPAGLWFRCPVDLQRIAWPTEDYRLARSLVETSLPEDDLFVGIRELDRAGAASGG
jgi:mycothiol S-conjugate amidase